MQIKDIWGYIRTRISRWVDIQMRRTVSSIAGRLHSNKNINNIVLLQVNTNTPFFILAVFPLASTLLFAGRSPHLVQSIAKGSSFITIIVFDWEECNMKVCWGYTKNKEAILQILWPSKLLELQIANAYNAAEPVPHYCSVRSDVWIAFLLCACKRSPWKSFFRYEGSHLFINTILLFFK